MFSVQVCEQCANVKFEREGYFITVDIEKGMQDGQVSTHVSKYRLTYMIFLYKVRKYVQTPYVYENTLIAIIQFYFMEHGRQNY